MKLSYAIIMLFSFPALVAGWVFSVMGLYYLGANLFGYTTSEENTSLAAIWAFLFSFGVISISGFLASKAKFASRKYVQQTYKYSIIISATLFLGYTVIGMAAGLINLTIGA